MSSIPTVKGEGKEEERKRWKNGGREGRRMKDR